MTPSGSGSCQRARPRRAAASFNSPEKGETRVRPWRIQAHVTISVIALLLERIAEIRVGDTWRNASAELERMKVVEYDRGEARVLQTTELQPETLALLRKLSVAPPAKLLSVGPIPSAVPARSRRRRPPPGRKKAQAT